MLRLIRLYSCFDALFIVFDGGYFSPPPLVYEKKKGLDKAFSAQSWTCSPLLGHLGKAEAYFNQDTRMTHFILC